MPVPCSPVLGTWPLSITCTSGRPGRSSWKRRVSSLSRQRQAKWRTPWMGTKWGAAVGVMGGFLWWESPHYKATGAGLRAAHSGASGADFYRELVGVPPALQGAFAGGHQLCGVSPGRVVESALATGCKYATDALAGGRTGALGAVPFSAAAPSPCAMRSPSAALSTLSINPDGILLDAMAVHADTFE